MNNFHIYDPIGKGKVSTVYKGRRKRTVEYVAVKSVPRDQKQNVMTEVKVMHAVSHPNVLRFHAWYETQNHLWLILEYCVGGDLAALLRADGRLPEAAVLRLGRDLSAGLQALHAAGLVHNDLRPASILLDEHGHAKLGGFSRAGRLEEVGTVSRQQRLHQAREQACLHYLAPELLQGAPTSIASDLWALGCLLYECTAGSPPFVFSGNTVSALTQAILGGSPPPLPEASPELRHLLSRLLARNPAERCCWADLCAHPFWGATPPVLVVGPEAEAELQASLHQWLQLHGLPPGGRAVSPPKTHLRISATGSSDLSGSSSRTGVGGSLSESLAAAVAEGDGAGPTPAHPRTQQLAAPPSAVAAAARNGAAAVAPQFLDFSSVAAALEPPPPPEGNKPGQRQAAALPRPQPSSPLPLPLSALIWHPSEAAMKPIVGNRRIERLPEPQYDASLLPFAPLSAAGLAALPPGRREAVVSEVTGVLAGPAHAHTKQAVLAYLESLCPDPGAVHLLLNSRAGEALAGLLAPCPGPSAAAGGGGSEEVRCAAAGLLGLLIRHASAVSGGLAATGLLDSLAAGVEPCAPPELQRRCAATLGELLFYVASQQRAGGPPGGDAWAVGGHHLAALLGLLGSGRDEVAQHYAAKATENICGLGGAWPARLATPDMQAALAGIVQRGGVGEGLRATAASALQRLLRCAPHLLEALLDQRQGGLARLTAWLADANLRVRQAGATCLCQLLASDAHMATLAVDILRAKALVAAALLVRSGWRGLAAVAGSRLLVQLDRCGLTGAGGGAGEAPAPPGSAAADAAYLGHAAAALRSEIAAALPPLLDELAARQRGGGGPGLADGDAGAQLRALQALLSSAALRDSLVSDELLSALADLLTWAVGSAGSREGEALMLVLQPIDAVASHAEALAGHRPAVLAALLPALSAAVASPRQSPDARFCCLKLLCDVVLAYLAEPPAPVPGAAPDPGEGGADSGSGEPGAAAALVDEAVARHVLPLMPALLQDEDPMPLYALKMLGILLEANPGWAADLARLGLARRLFEWLEVAHPHLNVHAVRLCRLVAAAGVVPAGELEALAGLGRAAAVLAYAADAGVEPFLEPALDLLAALLALPGGRLDPAPLLPYLPLLLGLAGHAEAELAAAAAGVAAALAAQVPREAASALAGPRCMAPLLAALKAEAPGGGGGGAREEALLALLSTLRAAVERDPLAFRGSVLALRSALLTASRGPASQQLRSAAAAVLSALQQ